MIIITRKIGESIILNDDVTITLINRKGKIATLGITAPKTYKIERKEAKIKKEQKLKHEQNQNQNQTSTDSPHKE